VKKQGGKESTNERSQAVIEPVKAQPIQRRQTTADIINGVAAQTKQNTIEERKENRVMMG